MTRQSSDPPALDDLLAAFGLAPREVQAFDPAHPRFDAQRPLLVLRPQFEAARPRLRERYPAARRARVLRSGALSEERVDRLPDNADAWLMPALRPEEDRRALAGLRGVMERLFAPDGCPWDREQTHESLRRFFLEESYELVDAIERGDLDGLCEELGDVQAHIFMQSALAQQSGAFSLEDVVAHAADKFVRRHPHVFGEEETDSPEALLERWEEIKRAERDERGEEDRAGALDSVPRAAPALQRAQALIGRARRAGVQDPELPPTAAIRDAVDALSREPSEERLGALLWAVVRQAREAGVDAEQALREAARRFTGEFQRVETEARERGCEIGDLPHDRRSAPWRVLEAPGR